MKQRIDDKDFCWFDDEQSFSLDKEYFDLFPNLFDNDGYNDLSAYLSPKATTILTLLQREKTILSRDAITLLLEENGIPAFETFIRFQQLYGGRCYKYFTRTQTEGYAMDIVYYNPEENTAQLCGYLKNQNTHYLQCMGEHYSAGYGIFIGDNGCLYEYNFAGSMLCVAQSMEEFMEAESQKIAIGKK